VTWSTNPDMKTLVESIPVNDSHEMFTLLNGKVSEEIVMAHRTPLAMAGIKINTGLQSDEALSRSNMEYYQNTVVRPSQTVIEDKLNGVLERNGIKVKTVIKPLRPIDILGSEELMSQVMTINEIRTKVLGIDILEEGGDSFLNDNNIVE